MSPNHCRLKTKKKEYFSLRRVNGNVLYPSHMRFSIVVTSHTSHIMRTRKLRNYFFFFIHKIYDRKENI